MGLSGRMWAVDVEGSGKSPPEIVELALVEIMGIEMSGKRMHWRFRPRNGISAMATRVHGIHEEDLTHEPDFVDVADDLVTWMEDAPIVGHNVRVELGLLGRGLPEWRPAGAIDTLRMARQLLPNQGKHGLEWLGKALGLERLATEITGATAHSAPHDATLSALLLSHLLGPLTEEGRTAALLQADILAGPQTSLLL